MAIKATFPLSLIEQFGLSEPMVKTPFPASCPVWPMML